jgi:hypothetical protein
MSSRGHDTMASRIIAGLALILVFVSISDAQKNTAIGVETDGAGPRQIESLTRNSVARDYGFAWNRLAQALETNAPELLDGYFIGVAQERLANSVSTQRAMGMSSRLLDPQHKAIAVFYAPEGDVMELHDTVSCRRQVLKDGRVIQEEEGVRHYVVLMTPAADRWVVRHIQEVENF